MQENNSTQKLVEGYNKAFINSAIESDPAFSPQFVINGNGQKVLSVIENEIRDCDDLFFSVAFITIGGLTPLLGTLNEFINQGKRGRILTTDYLMFSEPKALDKLNSLPNIDLKIYKTAENKVGFHTKGYMFHNGGNLKVLIGSSNLTHDAITRSKEWNTKFISTTNGQYAKDIENEFNNLWNSSVDYSDYKDEYTELYIQKSTERIELNRLTQSLDLKFSQVLQPNLMQQQFIDNIWNILKAGGERALLISATGTGKTYASAFAIRKLFSDYGFNNKKVLFLSHREQINKQALSSYKRIFGKNIAMDLLSGNNNDIQAAISANFLFSTMNMMSKDEVLQNFTYDNFSIIVLDECHRSGAQSYQKIIDYFKPKLLLGMSASPERTDGIDVFSLFDHNIACEIRLQQALDHDMLCPFHYFGITDLEIDGTSDDISKFNDLVSDKRVEYIIDKAEYYGFSGNRVKGLIFCSRKEEAQELSQKFNNTGKYKTLVLTGADSQEAREKAIERLVNDELHERIDYIFTVDIFNEGVDIPEINQVIMLRQTESPIVFVQQLGRGLRKFAGKEFVVILDFIGNYKNNYMIPIALTGDRTGNKDNIRRGLMEGNNIISGSSTIYFDPISRERIYKSIDSADLNQIRLLKQEYNSLKNKLGRIPMLKEFDDLGELDPLRIISRCGSYQIFLSLYDRDYINSYTERQHNVLKFISSKFASGMRIHELSLLKILIESPENISLWEKLLMKKYSITVDSITKECVKNVLTNKFFRGNLLSVSILDDNSKEFALSKEFLQDLTDEKFKKDILEVIDFGIYRYRRDYSKKYQNTLFNLYKKYTYQEVCWLLNWKKEEVSLNIGGYKFDKYSNTYPIFINYEKSEDIAATTKYEDRFIDSANLTAISKSKRTVNSDDVDNAIHSEERGITMPLFVRKNKDDKTSKEFYFLGTISHNGHLQEFIMPNTDDIHAVEIGYRLFTPVEQNLYNYLTDNNI